LRSVPILVMVSFSSKCILFLPRQCQVFNPSLCLFQNKASITFLTNTYKHYATEVERWKKI
jgi:hypothetical protein